MSHPQQSLFERIGGREGLTLLLRHFYADVRQHKLIGPIFNGQIQDWPEHLAKIAEFWARIMGGPSLYVGQMPAKHLHLGIKPQHFAAWLQLWTSNCRCYLKPQEAEEAIRLARDIASRLEKIISSEGVPEPLPPANSP